MTLPAVVRRDAPLPATYEAAKVALSQCSQVDECKEWADKAKALDSYARQANDDSLEKLAKRIRARAIRRAGDLLKTYQADKDENLVQNRGGDTPPSEQPRSQREAAAAAGMSKDQEKQAVRVSNVPQADFEAAVESEDPPTVTKLADMGKASRPARKEPPKPAGFYEATHVVGAMRRFAELARKHSPDLVAGGVMPSEEADVRALVHEIDRWLDQFIVNVETRAA